MTEYIHIPPDRAGVFGGREYNVYCDESCHLENDGAKAMSLGAIWCPKEKVSEINRRIKEIKAKHGVKNDSEVKWTKASPANLALYMDIVDYFFDDDDLHFRGLIVPDKSQLRHEDYSQTHDDWYHKMYFVMLKHIFDRNSHYYVYIDIKDTHSTERARELQEVCANDAYDFSHNIIRRIQPIRSEEVQVMQLVDILTGALAYRHNYPVVVDGMNSTKVAIVNRIISRARVNLTKTTLYSESKVNILVWSPRNGWGR